MQAGARADGISSKARIERWFDEQNTFALLVVIMSYSKKILALPTEP
jgi:hypothetical protein